MSVGVGGVAVVGGDAGVVGGGGSCGEGAEVPGDDVEGELGAPVLVEESLVVEGPWPSEGAGGGVGSAVDELPEGDAVEPRGLGEDGADLVEEVGLVLLGPVGAEAVAPAVDGAGADFGDDERLVVGTLLVEPVDEAPKA